jgi:hypothetical protein
MGYVVPDLEAAMAQWAQVLGAGPFTRLPHVAVENGRYRGAPTEVDISVATAELGVIQLELIEQHDDVPSCYRDLFERGNGGLHHVAVRTTAYDDELARYERLGCARAFEGSYRGTRFVYVDTSPALGIMVELVEAR